MYLLSTYCVHWGFSGWPLCEASQVTEAKSLQSCFTFCNSMEDYSPSGSSVHDILWTRILDCVAMPSSRGSSQPRDRTHISYVIGFGGWVFTTSVTNSVVKNACWCRRCRRHRFDPWIRKISWRREWQPTPTFLLGISHGQRSLDSYSPWGYKESDATE